MFQRLFAKDRETNRAIVDALYAKIVAAARQPAFYAEMHVADTPLGRFEMISLHMLLALRRMRSEPEIGDIAQGVTDQFFLELDHSLRELGIGDVSVPKRMKKLAKMYYGRAAAYSQALDERDEAAMASALLRNIWPDGTATHDARPLAKYALAAAAMLEEQSGAAIKSGVIEFPKAGG